MGLSGSGKTTLSRKLSKLLHAEHINADSVREEHNDWDFSYEGRMRQVDRLNKIAEESKKEYVILDFICPYKEGRSTISALFTIWMDTESSSRYKDTDIEFVEPDYFDVRFAEKGQHNLNKLIKKIQEL